MTEYDLIIQLQRNEIEKLIVENEQLKAITKELKEKIKESNERYEQMVTLNQLLLNKE